MAFTTITADTALNDLDLALEVAVAINKRCVAIGNSAIFSPLPAEGTNLKTFVRQAQTAVEGLLSAAGRFFCDPSSTLAGQSTLPSAWGVSAGMSAAGLTASGYWRRVPSGDTPPTAAQWPTYGWAGYSYGKCAEYDILGPWLWADLFAALSKITRTAYDPDPYVYPGGDPNKARYTSEGEADSTSGVAHELSGNVSLTVVDLGYLSGGTSAGEVTIAKTRVGSSVYSISADIYGALVNLPRVAMASASETYTIVYIPRGDNLFPEITGSINAGVTNTATDFEQETGLLLRWWWGYPSQINAASVPWATLSARVDWPDPDGTASKSVSLVMQEITVVTDYDFNDGSLS